MQANACIEYFLVIVCVATLLACALLVIDSLCCKLRLEIAQHTKTELPRAFVCEYACLCKAKR